MVSGLIIDIGVTAEGCFGVNLLGVEFALEADFLLLLLLAGFLVLLLLDGLLVLLLLAGFLVLLLLAG
jgi:hypothetical protein